MGTEMITPMVLGPCGEFAEAWAACQAELSNPAFDADNPHFRSRYTTLATLISHIRPVLAKHGFAFFQTVAPAIGSSGQVAIDRTDELEPETEKLKPTTRVTRSTFPEYVVLTTLVHKTGYISSIFPVRGDRMGAQAFVAATTYARRCALAALVGVAGADDDDGEEAEGRGGGNREAKRTGPWSAQEREASKRSKPEKPVKAAPLADSPAAPGEQPAVAGLSLDGKGRIMAIARKALMAASREDIAVEDFTLYVLAGMAKAKPSSYSWKEATVIHAKQGAACLQDRDRLIKAIEAWDVDHAEPSVAGTSS